MSQSHKAANVPPLSWDGAVPVSVLHSDPYYSRQNGLAEARHVFLSGNALPARFRPGFCIAELGFGTGLNVLAAWDAWRLCGQDGPLCATSFESRPLEPGDMARALAAFADIGALAESLIAAWDDADRTGTEIDVAPDHPGAPLRLTVVVGDAAERLPGWRGSADAWFLDGFAPARNPELWSPRLLRDVARRTAPGGSAASYSAAGHVRRSLEAAGFTVDRVPGYGRKRHMTRARLA